MLKIKALTFHKRSKADISLKKGVVSDGDQYIKHDKSPVQFKEETCQSVSPLKPALATAEISQENSQQSVALAVAVKKRSTYPLTWAVKNLPSFGGPILVLYIRRLVKTVPTALGLVPISQANQSYIKAYMMELQNQTSQFFKSLEHICKMYKVVPEFIEIESDEPVHKILLKQIAEKKIYNLIIGSSSSALRFKKSISDYVFRNAPEYCTVTIVSKSCKVVHGKKLDDSISCRTSNVSGDELLVDENLSTSETNEVDDSLSACETNEESNEAKFAREHTSTNIALPSTAATPHSVPIHKSNVPIDIEDLKIQVLDIIKKAEEMTRKHSEEEKMKEELIQATKLAKEQAEVQAATYRKELENAEIRRKALEEEITSLKAGKNNASLESKLVNSKNPNYTLEELRDATNNFSRNAKISESCSSLIYKGRLKQRNVAIKCLKDNIGCQEFQDEIDKLSSLHHPHMLQVLGGCAEKHSIVYEYVSNGSLQDCLFSKARQSRLPWYIRFRIAYEISSAVYFLHTQRPHPIVHQHINPRKILFDKNYGSKLSIGCASIFSQNQSFKVCSTSLYLDPEYQQTGVLCPMFDIYCLGILMLQLLTGKDDDGIYKIVEHAVDHGSLSDVLDCRAGEWPFLEAMQMACLALRCAERSSNYRPSLELDVLNVLEKIKESGDEYVENHSSRSHGEPTCPAQFICPIEQETMKNPVIAEDGFTYEYEAIKSWLDQHDTSPMTNLELRRKDLIPNHALRSAIVEWKLSQHEKRMEDFMSSYLN